MSRETNKAELYIIAGALVLSIVVLGGFWLRNKGVSSKKASIPTSSVSLPQPVPETKVDSTQTVPPKVEHHGLAKLLDSGKVNAIVLGDSLAESNGASNKVETGWSATVARDLQTQYPGKLAWSFKSGEGFTVNDILPLLPDLPVDSDMVLISLGRSDSSRIKLSDFKQKYQEIIQQVQAKSPQANIYLLVEPPIKNIPENNTYFPYRQAILELGQQNKLQVIDEWQAFINDPSPLSDLLVDGVNPNDKGYRIFADTVLKNFKEFLISSK